VGCWFRRIFAGFGNHYYLPNLPVGREIFKSENRIIYLRDCSDTFPGQFFEKFPCSEIISRPLGGMGVTLYDMFNLLYLDF